MKIDPSVKKFVSMYKRELATSAAILVGYKVVLHALASMKTPFDDITSEDTDHTI